MERGLLWWVVWLQQLDGMLLHGPMSNQQMSLDCGPCCICCTLPVDRDLMLPSEFEGACDFPRTYGHFAHHFAHLLKGPTAAAALQHIHR